VVDKKGGRGGGGGGGVNGNKENEFVLMLQTQNLKQGSCSNELFLKENVLCVTLFHTCTCVKINY